MTPSAVGVIRRGRTAPGLHRRRNRDGPSVTSQGILHAARPGLRLRIRRVRKNDHRRRPAHRSRARGKNSRSISLFSTSTASTGNCPIFIANIRSVFAHTSSGVLTKTIPPIAARPVVQACILTTTSPPSSFAAATASSACVRGLTARDFESIRREDGFALIFVKTRHGCVLISDEKNAQRSTLNVLMQESTRHQV